MKLFSYWTVGRPTAGVQKLDKGVVPGPMIYRSSSTEMTPFLMSKRQREKASLRASGGSCVGAASDVSASRRTSEAERAGALGASSPPRAERSPRSLPMSPKSDLASCWPGTGAGLAGGATATGITGLAAAALVPKGEPGFGGPPDANAGVAGLNAKGAAGLASGAASGLGAASVAFGAPAAPCAGTSKSTPPRMSSVRSFEDNCDDAAGGGAAATGAGGGGGAAATGAGGGGGAAATGSSGKAPRSPKGLEADAPPPTGAIASALNSSSAAVSSSGSSSVNSGAAILKG